MEPNFKQILLTIGFAFLMSINAVMGLGSNKNDELMKAYYRLYDEYATKKTYKIEAGRNSALVAH